MPNLQARLTESLKAGQSALRVISELQSQLAITHDHIQKLQVTNGDLTNRLTQAHEQCLDFETKWQMEMDKSYALQHQNQKLREALEKIAKDKSMRHGETARQALQD